MYQVIEEVNSLLASVSGGTYPRLSPEEGNVIFASSYMNWSFTLKVRPLTLTLTPTLSYMNWSFTLKVRCRLTLDLASHLS